MSARAAVILAAGQGTRMRSPRPKVLHAVGGRTLIDRAIDAVEALGCNRIAVVVGAHAPAVAQHVRARLGEGALAVQDPPLGTGDAVRAARPALAGFDGQVLVVNADAPLLDAEALGPLVQALDAGADLALLAFEPREPGALGRLVLDAAGRPERIVEARDATPAELEIRRVYAGMLAAPAARLFDWVSRIGCDNAGREYYLTDVVALARADGAALTAVLAPESKVMGVNSQAELAQAEALFQAARRAAALDAGVCMPAPDTVMFAHDTVVEGGAVVEPYVVFGPGVRVQAGATVRAFSHLEGAVVMAGAVVGPYARLRPGAEIGRDAHIGNFVEVKKVRVGEGAKANHLTYLGDGTVGAGANIGAGVIFCNYDGFDKHETHVGAGAFIGSDTALVAPVRVGAGAYTGSGSVITRDVADDALALTRPPHVEKPGWAAAFRRLRLAQRGAK